MSSYVLIVVASAVFVMLPALSKVHALHALIPGAVSGLLSFGAVHLGTALLGGASLLAANPFTLMVAAMFGVPGVVGMLMLRLIALAG